MKVLLEKFGGFLRTVGRSCYDMEFYRTVRTGSLVRAVSYFASFAALLVVVGTVLFAPALFRAKGELRQWVSVHLADRTTFAIKEGRLSSSIEESTDLGTGGKLVLDTGYEGSLFPEEKYPSADVVIGRDAVFLRKDATEQRTYLLSDYPDLSLTKEDILARMDRYGFAALAGFIFFAALLYGLFFMIGMAVYVLFVAALALLAGKAWKISMDYGQWVAVGLHALTLPILVDILLDAIELRIPYSFSFIFVLFIGAIIADERAAPAGPVIPPSAPSATPSKPRSGKPRTRKKKDSPPSEPPARS